MICFYLWVVAGRVVQSLLPDRYLLDEGVGIEDTVADEVTEVGEDVDVGEAVWVLGAELHDCKDGIIKERKVEFLEGSVVFKE